MNQNLIGDSEKESEWARGMELEKASNLALPMGTLQEKARASNVVELKELEKLPALLFLSQPLYPKSISCHS